jgi:CobQ-like glutamine amidotransferase family enzyme
VAIGLLFPELLGTYGDRGNAIALRSRLERRGLAARIVEVQPDESIPESLDIYLLGGGEDHAEIVALDRLERSPLRAAWERGAAVVGVCAGLQLLGTRLLLEGSPRDGLGFFSAATEPGGVRSVGEVVIDSCDPALGRITGFENHQGVTVVGEGAQPLGRHPDGRAEGVLGDRLVGTYLHGPVLVRNPRLADRVLTWVTGPLGPLDDGYEAALHDARVAAVGRKGRRR